MHVVYSFILKHDKILYWKVAKLLPQEKLSGLFVISVSVHCKLFSDIKGIDPSTIPINMKRGRLQNSPGQENGWDQKKN